MIKKYDLLFMNEKDIHEIDSEYILTIKTPELFANSTIKLKDNNTQDKVDKVEKILIELFNTMLILSEEKKVIVVIGENYSFEEITFLQELNIKLSKTIEGKGFLSLEIGHYFIQSFIKDFQIKFLSEGIFFLYDKVEQLKNSILINEMLEDTVE